MAGSPVKRVLGTLLFTVALLVTLGFVFLLFAESENLSDVPGTDNIEQVGFVVAIMLSVIALLMLILLIVRRLDWKAQKAAEAEAYYIPEEDREAMRRQKAEQFDQAFQGAPGPAPSPPDVKVYHLPAVPIATQAWGDAEKARVGRTHPFYFPRMVDAGVYVNDYIQVDRKGTRLKLRTLLAGHEDYPEVGDVKDEPPTPPAEPVKPAEPEEVEEAPEEPEEVPEVPVRANVSPGSGAATRELKADDAPLPGDQFMQELESRQGEVQNTDTAMASAAPTVHYDYAGDTHFVEEVEGIGPKFGHRLREQGIQTTARLCFEDPLDLSTRIDAPTKTVRRWQATAELMKVKGIGPQYAEALARAGIAGIQELKERDADDIADQVNAYLDGLETTVTAGKITSKRVDTWKANAKGMRRVRMAVPTE